jgi:hypothetical protein
MNNVGSFEVIYDKSFTQHELRNKKKILLHQVIK